MAAKLHNLDACPDLFAVSVYNTKPVHILSTAANCVKWIVKEKKVWSDGLQKKALMKYVRLNVTNDYNNNMNLMDIANQLRGSYRTDRWMRQCKWWWALFIWAIGVAGVNANKIYEVIYDKEDAKKMPGLPPRWTHGRFLEELVYDFHFPRTIEEQCGHQSRVDRQLGLGNGSIEDLLVCCVWTGKRL